MPPRPLITWATGLVLPGGLITALEDLLLAADLQGCHVTSVARTPEAQARAMYNNIRATSPQAQQDIYAAAGDQVIEVYRTSKAAGKSESAILADMTAKIYALGPAKVSHHCVPADAPIWVCDIRRNSILNEKRWKQACDESPRVEKLLDENGVWHIEILKGGA